MRLAFVLFNWFPHGGLQKDLVKVVQACQHNADISIYCMAWDGARLPGVTTVVVPVTGWTAAARRRQFARHIETRVSKGFDRVIGFNRMPGLDFYFAADTCFAEKVRERGWWYRLAPRTRQYLGFERAVFGANASTRALLLSPQQREQYRRHYQTPENRLLDIPPGIGREHRAGSDADKLRADFRREFGIADDALVVLQTGSGFKTKGVRRSLLAMASLPADVKRRVHYMLIGRDAPARWSRLAARLGLANQVRIMPPRDDIPRVMQGADVLLHPSVHESAGMVLLEAIVAGLPVLTTANCGYAFHVTEAQAGVVCAEPFDQAELDAALLRMLRADQSRSEWRANGIRYGQTRNLYDMPQTVANILTDTAEVRRTPVVNLSAPDNGKSG